MLRCLIAALVLVLALPAGAQSTLSRVGAATTEGRSSAISTVITVLAANANRREWHVRAEKANTVKVYCRKGSGATTSNSSIELDAGESYIDDGQVIYTGIVTCISADGSTATRVLVSEL